ncbi:MAG TPA: hypothetical protein VEA16_19530, partial [Vicinamibacterales bacterium]|nr:hypothetical protein [Vicinamibacterales bacterium]
MLGGTARGLLEKTNMASVAPKIMSDNDLNAVIVDPNQLTERIAEWKAQGFHVLSPAIKFTSFAPNFGANVAALIISTDPALGECYYDHGLMKQDERAIGRVGLDKIAQLAGVSWLPSSRRTDLRTIQRLWEYHVDGAYVSYDGTPQIISGTAEVDLRDGSDQIGAWTPEAWKELLQRNASLPDNQKVWNIGGWSEARVAQARRFGLRLCETKAKNAAIRTLGLKAKYTLAELEKPFIILRFQYIPDYEDETVRHMLAAAHMRGVSALYAGTARELPAGGADVLDFSTTRREPVPVGASSTPAAIAPPDPKPAAATAAPKPAAPAAPAPKATTVTPAPAPAAAADPAVSPANYIRQVKREERKYGQNHQKAGQTFIKFHVIDGEGVDHVTIRTKLGELAEK